MNEIEKQIEEMAREFCPIVCPNQCNHRCINVGNCQELIDACIKIRDLGYRNCKDKVVLSKEEWKTVCDNISNAESQGRKINDIYGQCLIENQILKKELAKASELKTETIKLAKREVARDILKRGKLCMPSGLREWIEKQYGVEVE